MSLYTYYIYDHYKCMLLTLWPLYKYYHYGHYTHITIMPIKICLCAGELCRACRFDRCVLGGMNVRAIRSIPAELDLEQASRAVERRRAELLQLQLKNRQGTQEYSSPMALIKVKNP